MTTKYILFGLFSTLTFTSIGQYFDQFKNNLVIQGHIKEIIETKRVKKANHSQLIRSTSKYNINGNIKSIHFTDDYGPNEIQNINFSYLSDNRIGSISTQHKNALSIKLFHWKNHYECDYAETFVSNHLLQRELFYYNSHQKLDSVLTYQIKIVDSTEHHTLLNKIIYKRDKKHNCKQIIECEYATPPHSKSFPIRKTVTLPNVNYIHLYKDGEYKVSQPLISDYQEKIRKLDYYRNNYDNKNSEDHVVILYNEKGYLISQSIENKHSHNTIRIKRRYIYTQF